MNDFDKNKVFGIGNEISFEFILNIKQNTYTINKTHATKCHYLTPTQLKRLSLYLPNCLIPLQVTIPLRYAKRIVT